MYGLTHAVDTKKPKRKRTPRTWMNKTPTNRWQDWIDDVYLHTFYRTKPLKFTPPSRCIQEQNLSGNLVVLQEDGRVFDGNKEVGRVSP